MHLLIRHTNGRYVRDIVHRSRLDLALLSKYRTAPAQGDGLFLRFEELTQRHVRSGLEELADVAGRTIEK